MVLLKNRDPSCRSRRIWTVAVIGGHADCGVLGGGGGSSEVLPHGGDALKIRHPEGDFDVYRILHRTVTAGGHRAACGRRADSAMPMAAISHAAAAAAQAADVAIVFATQWTSESVDAPDLSLPGNQDALIAAVAAANPHTIVVLETGGAVPMPWLDAVAGVVEAWYPGSAGAEAIARVLFGESRRFRPVADQLSGKRSPIAEARAARL